MNETMADLTSHVEEHRAFLVSRGFHLFGSLVTRIIPDGSEVIFCDPPRYNGWWPHTTKFPNDVLWRSPLEFDTIVEAYVYAELHSWGRV